MLVPASTSTRDLQFSSTSSTPDVRSATHRRHRGRGRSWAAGIGHGLALRAKASDVVVIRRMNGGIGILKQMSKKTRASGFSARRLTLVPMTSMSARRSGCRQATSFLRRRFPDPSSVLVAGDRLGQTLFAFSVNAVGFRCPGDQVGLDCRRRRSGQALAVLGGAGTSNCVGDDPPSGAASPWRISSSRSFLPDGWKSRRAGDRCRRAHFRSSAASSSRILPGSHRSRRWVSSGRAASMSPKVAWGRRRSR